VSARAAAWTGLGAGALTLGLVVALFDRVLSPAGEIDRYASHILDAANAISKNLEGADALATTQALGSAVPGLAVAYLRKLGVAG